LPRAGSNWRDPTGETAQVLYRFTEPTLSSAMPALLDERSNCSSQRAERRAEALAGVEVRQQFAGTNRRSHTK